jgi:hypothetical protein
MERIVLSALEDYDKVKWIDYLWDIFNIKFFCLFVCFLSVGTGGPTAPTPSGAKGSTPWEQSTGATTPRNSGESQTLGTWWKSIRNLKFCLESLNVSP